MNPRPPPRKGLGLQEPPKICDQVPKSAGRPRPGIPFIVMTGGSWSPGIPGTLFLTRVGIEASPRDNKNARVLQIPAYPTSAPLRTDAPHLAGGEF